MYIIHFYRDNFKLVYVHHRATLMVTRVVVIMIILVRLIPCGTAHPSRQPSPASRTRIAGSNFWSMPNSHRRSVDHRGCCTVAKILPLAARTFARIR